MKFFTYLNFKLLKHKDGLTASGASWTSVEVGEAFSW